MFHCLVIKVSVFVTAFIIYHTFKTLSTTFFKFFELIFQSCFDYFSDVFAASLMTHTLYHVISHLSSYILNILKFYLFVLILETFICDSLVIISHHVIRVNTFLIVIFLTVVV